MTCLGYNKCKMCIFRNLSVKCENDIIRLIKKVKRIMVNCQIKDPRDIM